MAPKLAAMQKLCFPTAEDVYLIKAGQYRKHIELFPQGQHLVLDENDEPVAASSDMRTDIDLGHIEHRHLDITHNNGMTGHKPDGQWLYGFDISVHPEYRGLGLGRMLYAARRALVRKLNLRGHAAGGLLSAYGALKNQMSAKDYAAKVSSGEIFDPALSVQLKNGFRITGIIDNYVDDPACDNKAAFIIWENDAYVAQ